MVDFWQSLRGPFGCIGAKFCDWILVLVWKLLKEKRKREKKQLLTRSARFTRAIYTLLHLLHLCTAPHSKIRLNFVKHFRIFTVLLNLCSKMFFQLWSKLHQQLLWCFFRNFNNLYDNNQNLLDDQISWNFATNLFLKNSENDLLNSIDFREVRKS